jgi:PTH1 family peptidyl-tRNA hydrolase
VVPGQAKLKRGGSHAGHNGLRDIHAQLGTGDYWRLRLGIGHPGVKSEVIGWVLKKPLKEQREAIEDAIARTLHAFPALVAGEMDKATLLIHTSKPPRPKPPRREPGEGGPPAPA